MAFALSPSLAQAEPTPAIAAAQKKVASAISRWEQAKKELEQTRANAQALEHRIAALKRLRERGNGGGSVDAELTALLRDSVAQDSALRSDGKEVDQRDAEVRRSIVEAFAVIDARIKDVIPRMKMGELDARQAAARNIGELRNIRDELRKVVDRLRAPAAKPQQWSKYEVKIDPLDGPKELKEKADFVEDTRDRFSKKRELLAKLIRDAREEQSLSHAAKDFQTDTRLFDEESRRDRVVKQNARSELSTDVPAVATGPAGGGDRSNESPAEALLPPPQSPDPHNGFDANPTTDDKLGSETPILAGGGDPGGQTPGGGDPGVQITKQLDVNALLNLRVEALESGNADLATLEALAADLAKLDGFLGSQAAELRKRADQLKQDEAKALSEQK